MELKRNTKDYQQEPNNRLKIIAVNEDQAQIIFSDIQSNNQNTSPGKSPIKSSRKVSQMDLQSLPQDKLCFICDQQDSDLIQPCLCDVFVDCNYQVFCHPQCIKARIQAKNVTQYSEEDLKCQICFIVYKILRIDKIAFSKIKQAKGSACWMIMKIILILLILGGLTFWLYWEVQSYQDINSQVLIVSLLLFVFLLLFVYFVLEFVRNFQESSWEVKPIRFRSDSLIQVEEFNEIEKKVLFNQSRPHLMPTENN